MQNIPPTIINKIDCVGTPDKKGPRICAATGTSYFQKDSWAIFIKPSYMKVFMILSLVLWKTQIR